MIPELNSGGVLPLGRHLATWDDVEERYCFTDHRRHLYRECRQLARIAQAVPPGLSAVWIGGSFVSAKTDPNDIDVLFVRNSQDSAGLGKADAQVIDGLASSTFSREVNSAILEWWPRCDDRRDGEDYEYRGFFDFRMSRVKGLPDPESGMPRKGYLEVIVDGYK